jgi:septin family protein
MRRSRYELSSVPLVHANIAQSILPFAVVGSEKTIVVNGREVRGRQNRWGVINGQSFASTCSSSLTAS